MMLCMYMIYAHIFVYISYIIVQANIWEVDCILHSYNSDRTRTTLVEMLICSVLTNTEFISEESH